MFFTPKYYKYRPYGSCGSSYVVSSFDDTGICFKDENTVLPPAENFDLELMLKSSVPLQKVNPCVLPPSFTSNE